MTCTEYIKHLNPKYQEYARACVVWLSEIYKTRKEELRTHNKKRTASTFYPSRYDPEFKDVSDMNSQIIRHQLGNLFERQWEIDVATERMKKKAEDILRHLPL